MSIALKVAILILCSSALAFYTRRSLTGILSHGLYRLLAWIATLALALANLEFWFHNPVSAVQLTSWVLLALSVFLVGWGVVSLRRGHTSVQRGDKTLLPLEQTNVLVTSGAYAYIRHPIYASFIPAAIGILLKHITYTSAVLMVAVIAGATLAARCEERENIDYFGNEYLEYMKQTHRFVPYVY